MFQDIPIRIRLNPSSKRSEATGFWLPYDDVNVWLQTMLLAQNACEGEVDFYILPPERNSRVGESSGVSGLIGLPRSNFSLHRSAIATPLSPIRLPTSKTNESAGFTTLWLPESSELAPAIPPRWLGQALHNTASTSNCLVWLPNIGLVALEQADRVTIVDLIRPADHADASHVGDHGMSPIDPWQSPPSLSVLPERIAGFQVIGVENLRDPLKDLASEFGHRADDLWSEPHDRTEGAKRRGLHKNPHADSLVQRGTKWALRKLDDWFASRDKGSQKQVDKSHRPPSQPSGQDKLNATSKPRKRGISAYLFDKLASSVERQRQQQVNKLLEMFKRDPDRALQFAIPLAGDGRFRGLTVPGSQLLSRMPEFSLSNFSGCGPADIWSMDYQQQQRLRESYLATANRELAAKRYRRAAYIHAHLLGDFAAAAGVLEQGGFYREASALYLDKLKRVSDGARCLVLAGLFEQAVELYESLGDHEMVASTWEKAGREDEMRSAYRRAVESLIAKGRIRDAASLLKDKLNQRQQAKELLWAQWPSGREVLACALMYFEMLADDCQHDVALANAKSAVERESVSSSVDIAKLLIHLAKSYPSKSVQQYAYDSCRIMAARTIQNLGVDATKNAVQILRELDDDDLLLKHDCIRYVTSKTKSPAKALSSAPSPVSTSNRLEKLVGFRLPSGRYDSAKIISNFLFAVQTYDSGGLRAGIFCPAERAIGDRVYPAGSSVSELLTFRGDAVHSVSNYRSRGKEHVFIHSANAGMTENSTQEITTADSVGWIVSQQIPVALAECESVVASSNDFWFGTEFTHGSWHLKTCGENCENLRYWPMVDATDAQTKWSVDGDTDNDLLTHSLVRHRRYCLLASIDGVPVTSFGRTLTYGFGSDGQSMKSIAIPGAPLCLAGGPLGTRKRIAVGHHKGLVVIWPAVGGYHLEVACNERPYNQLLWLPGGRLYALSDHWLTRFHVKNHQIRAQGTIKLRSEDVVALVALGPSICGAVYGDGVVEGY
ncbi:MAG TPA: hypothetical protein DDZ51_07410 [Planctomycetaceae bacterium]|nr:hypothetical protein [Planctomycetaceae bacterium]